MFGGAIVETRAGCNGRGRPVKNYLSLPADRKTDGKSANRYHIYNFDSIRVQNKRCCKDIPIPPAGGRSAGAIRMM